MKQTFPLTHPRHKPPQALALLKNRIRKYLKRERRKTLPEGTDYWAFDCRVGPTEDEATEAHVAEVIGRIDDIAQAGGGTVYVEILAKAATRTKKEDGEGHGDS